MKVYALEAYGDYCGGMAVVSAENVDQAIALAFAAGGRSNIWNVGWKTPEKTSELDVSYGGAPKVLAFFETGE